MCPGPVTGPRRRPREYRDAVESFLATFARTPDAGQDGGCSKRVRSGVGVVLDAVPVGVVDDAPGERKVADADVRRCAAQLSAAATANGASRIRKVRHVHGSNYSTQKYSANSGRTDAVAIRCCHDQECLRAGAGRCRGLRVRRHLRGVRHRPLRRRGAELRLQGVRTGAGQARSARRSVPPSSPTTASRTWSVPTWSPSPRSADPSTCRRRSTRSARPPTGRDHPDRLLGRVRRRRGGPAGRQAVHDALDARRRAGADVSHRAGRPQCAVRRRRQPDHQRGHRGGHRRLSAPGAPRTGQRGHQQDRAAHGGAAAARRRPAAVHRTADPGALLGRLRSPSGLDPDQPREAAHRRESGRSGPACRRAPSRAGSSRRRAARPCSGSPISGCSTPARLLEETDLDIDRVADRSGFGTATLLRHHFRRIIGVTPSDYRRSFAVRRLRLRRNGLSAATRYA